jgi:hypothetical protein
MTDETLNGDESGYAVGLPVWVDVKPDGWVTFTVDLGEADDGDDLAPEQDHLRPIVRDALDDGNYTVGDGDTSGKIADLRAAYARARDLADGEAISACEVLLDALAEYLGEPFSAVRGD